MALFGARKLKVAIKSLEIWAQTFTVSPCLNSLYQKLIFVIVFSTNQSAWISGDLFLGSKNANNCYYSAKQWHTLVLMINKLGSKYILRISNIYVFLKRIAWKHILHQFMKLFATIHFLTKIAWKTILHQFVSFK